MSNRPINRRNFIGSAALGSMSALALDAQTSNTPNASGVKVEKNVAVGKSGDVELSCDIYRPPAGTEKHMALIHFHGGALMAGSKDTLGAKVTPITARGYVSIAAQYRLAPKYKWPAMLEDAKIHVHWVREHANQLGIDPNRIGLAGYSAGGQIALYTSSLPEEKIAACVGFYPETGVGGLANMVMPPGSDQAAIEDTDPVNHIKAGFPPTIVFHGLADVTIPPENSFRLLKALRDAKVHSELHTFDGVPHEFDSHPEFADACASLTDFFLEREVLHPRTYPPFNFGRPRRNRKE
ncbi:MAG: alpha/beta hydrolase [Bryobacteraceae bacterium]